MPAHAPILFDAGPAGVVTIREMDEDYVFAGDMARDRASGKRGCCTADRAIDPRTAVPNPVFEAFHRQAMRRYGQSAVLAWHEGLVVGFINFHPLNASFDVLCPHDDSKENQARFAAFQWPEEPSQMLRIVCVDVAPEFRRIGLGTRLAQALIDWAPDWGFSRLHVGANENAWWIPCKPFWDALGFEVVRTVEFGKPNAVGDTRVFVMERDV